MWHPFGTWDTQNTLHSTWSPRGLHILQLARECRQRRLNQSCPRPESPRIAVREAHARMLATPGTWEEASEAYAALFDEAPGFRDVGWQLLQDLGLLRSDGASWPAS